MTRMNDTAEAERESIETVLFRLRKHHKDFELDQLRLRQAMNRRPELAELLGPVLTNLSRYGQDYDYAAHYLGGRWRRKQAAGWKE